MSEKIVLPAGMKVKLDDRKFTLTENYVVAGDLVTEAEKPQKTYMVKVICPSCNRIGRFTHKNWTTTELRAAVQCLHMDGSLHSMEIEDATADTPDYAG